MMAPFKSNFPHMLIQTTIPYLRRYVQPGEKRRVILDDRCSCVLGFSRTGGRLYKGRLFILIESVWALFV